MLTAIAIFKTVVSVGAPFAFGFTVRDYIATKKEEERLEQEDQEIERELEEIRSKKA